MFSIILQDESYDLSHLIKDISGMEVKLKRKRYPSTILPSSIKTNEERAVTLGTIVELRGGKKTIKELINNKIELTEYKSRGYLINENVLVCDYYDKNKPVLYLLPIDGIDFGSIPNWENTVHVGIRRSPAMLALSQVDRRLKRWFVWANFGAMRKISIDSPCISLSSGSPLARAS